MEIDVAKTTQRLIEFLQKIFRETGFTKAVIGLSGGVDSATSCALTVRVLGPDNVLPLLLPCGDLNPQGLIDAQAVISFLQISAANVIKIDIAPAFQEISHDSSRPAGEAGNQAVKPDQVRRGNIMARVRMIYLFDQAKRRRALVVGTENKSERLLGYFTRFGDSASDIEPLAGLYKTQVYQLAKYLGVPQPILTKPPTAGLWKGQTDEGEFGFTYKEADQILNLLYDQKKTVAEIIAAGFAKELVEKVQKRVQENEFKHHLPWLP